MWGFTAILGKAITLSALPLVAWRLMIAVCTLLPWMILKKEPLLPRRGSKIDAKIDGRALLELWGTGFLAALHWGLFYGCIKVAGIAIAVITLSTLSFFTAFLEPFVFRRSLQVRDVILGLPMVVGVSMLYRIEGGVPMGGGGSWLGLLMGLGSAFFSAALGVVNGKLALEHPSRLVTLHELVAAAVTCIGGACLTTGVTSLTGISSHDLMLVGVLAIGCTVLPWEWSLTVVRSLGPYTVAMAVTLEPVYSMLVAYWIFPNSERLTFRFYAGSSLLVGVVLFEAWLKRARSSVDLRNMAAAVREGDTNNEIIQTT